MFSETVSAGRKLAIPLTALLLHTATAAAAPWFGQGLPPPVNNPTQSIFAASDLPALPAKFGPGPKSPLLNGEKIKADAKTVIGFSLESKAAGDYLWGRVSGTPAYMKTASWAVDQLKAAGLSDAHLEEFTANLSIPTAGEARLLGDASFGDGTSDVVLQSAMVGGRGPVNGSVSAPLIYVGHATEADMVGRDVKGKIAVLHTTVNPGLYSADEIGRPAALIKAGAVGVLEILDQVSNMQSYDSDRHGCGVGMCFTVGGADGFFLENMLGKAGQAGKTVSARLSSTAKEQTGLKTANGVATIPGKTQRTIIINAHADAWFVGGDDNAGGLATQIALARYFAKGPKPEHTLVFIVSAGHHTAGQGVPAFRLKHESDYVSKSDLIINLEHVSNTGLVRSMVRPGPRIVAINSPGSPAATAPSTADAFRAMSSQTDNFGMPMAQTTAEWPKAVAVSNRAPFLIDLWRQGVNCFGLSVERIVDTSPPGELGGFMSVQLMQRFLGSPGENPYKNLKDLSAVPETQMISVGPLYHTSGETIDAVPAPGLERAARFHAYLIRAADVAAPDLLKGSAWTPSASCPKTP